MKSFLSVLLVLSTVALAGLLDHLPANYESALYVGDLQELYSKLKSTNLGNALLDMMGLESMADNFIASQLQAYEIDPNDFYSSLKELLFVTDGNNALVAVGPVKNPQKLVSAVNEILAGQGKAEIVDGYLVLSTGEELTNAFKNGGGTVPEKVSQFLKDPSTLGVSFSKTKLAVGYGRAWFENGTIISQGRNKALDEEGKAVMASLKPKSPFKEKDLIKGDAFVMVNTGNMKEIIKYLKSTGILTTENAEIDEKKLEELGNTALICVEFSQAFVQVFQGESEEFNGKLLGYIDMSTTMEELKEQNKDCQVQNGYLVCEKFYMKPEKSRLWLYYPDPNVSLSGGVEKFFEESYTGDEVVLAYADFSKVLQDVFGLSQSSYIVLKVWVEGNELMGRLEIK